jgi:sulfonate transport system permease protein
MAIWIGDIPRSAWPRFRAVNVSAALSPLILPLLVLLAWQAAADRGWVAIQILPPPAMVLRTLGDLLRDGTIAENLQISLVRIAIGFAVGSGAGLALGVLLGVSDRIEHYLGPLFRAIAQVPSIGWLPILILIFGIGEALKYVIIAKACFVPIVLNTSDGIRNIPAPYIEVARAFRLRRRTLLFKLVLPAALPSIFSGVRLAVGHAWIALVVVEMLAATTGIGYMMIWGRTLFQTDVVIAGMIMIGLIGLLIDAGLKRIERFLRNGAVARSTAPAGSLSSRKAGQGGAVSLGPWRGLAVPAALVVLWAVTAHLGLVNRHILPPVEKVLLAPFLDPDGRNLWPALGISLARMLGGFAIGASAGLAIGLVMGMWRGADRAIGPSLNALRQITLFAWIPLLTAWFGASDAAKLVFVSLSAFFPMALNAYEGLRNVPRDYVEVADVLRLSRRRRIGRLLLPGALPAIALGLRLALIYAWIGTVGAEYAIGQGRGIGTFIAAGREQFRMDIVIVGVIALALIGLLANDLLRHALARLMPWHEASR